MHYIKRCVKYYSCLMHVNDVAKMLGTPLMKLCESGIHGTAVVLDCTGIPSEAAGECMCQS